MASLLKKLVAAEQWDAEDIAGRLGIVAHAAFLRAGFVPFGAAPRSGNLLLKRVDEIGPSAPWLSRRYTAPQLVALGEEEGAAAAEVAELEIRGRGDGGDVAFQAYLLTRDDGGHRRCLCEALLHGEAHLAPILSGGLDDAARALETTAGSWLWKSLADWVCRVLFLVLCRRNDLPVTGFLSVPDDAKAEILRRLPDGKDLARVECSSRLLRRLVAERDGELWKAMYERLDLMVPEPEEEESLDDLDVPAVALTTWKERYVHALAAQQQQANRLRYFEELFATILPPSFSTYQHLDAAMDMHVPSRWELSVEDYYFPFNMEPIEEHMDFYVPPYLVLDPLPPPPVAVPVPEVVVRSRRFGGRHRKEVPQKYPKKQRHGAGATHSPSSRYRWRHR